MPAEGKLDVVGITAGYGETRILEDVSFSVSPGARVALLGRNGVGKTTTLATLVGQTTFHGGSIQLDGMELTRLKSFARAAGGLGYVPQTRNIFPSLSVEENLITGLKRRPRAALDEAYALFPRLKERRRNPGSSLSGGEQQMLTVARTLLGQPKVLLLDEPLEGLAPVICDQLMAALSSLSMSVLLVEQQIDRALDFCETVVVLDRGKVVHRGPSTTFRNDTALMERHLSVALSV